MIFSQHQVALLIHKIISISWHRVWFITRLCVVDFPSMHHVFETVKSDEIVSSLCQSPQEGVNIVSAEWVIPCYRLKYGINQWSPHNALRCNFCVWSYCAETMLDFPVDERVMFCHMRLESKFLPACDVGLRTRYQSGDISKRDVLFNALCLPSRVILALYV